MLRRTALAVQSTLVAAVTAAGCAPPEATGMQELVDRWRARADVPAVVVGVQDHGRRWVGASGTAERGGGVPVRPDARFRVASITKTVVAVVVLQLVEEGRLGLDDPVSGLVAGFPVDGVTVRHLLSHTSGIPDYSLADGFGRSLLHDRERRWSTGEVLDLVADLPPEFPPGTDFRYSNTNYVLLGQVVTAVTGAGWAEEVRRRVLDPLGMGNTYVAGSEPAGRPVVAAAYADADGDGDTENVETAGPWPALETSEGPAGAVISTVDDLLTFGEALFHGRLVAEGTLTEMVEDRPFHPRTSGYGLGVEILRPDYRTVVWGHGGTLPGFRSALWFVPSRDAVVVVLANASTANPADLAELLVRRLPVPQRP